MRTLRDWASGWRMPLLAVAGAAGLAASPAAAQVLSSNDFENGVTGGWECTSWEPPHPTGGNPGAHLHVLDGAWQWLTLRNLETGTPLIGNLSRHGGALELKVDIRVFILENNFGDPMDPANFPICVQFVDAADPSVSVFKVFEGMPAVAAGWVTYTFEIPDPAQTALPPGWGGTGDEDPTTFEPILPPGRNYANVMDDIGEARVTTAIPGFFYISNRWEAGYDTVVVSRAAGGGCYANCDGSTAAPALNVADFGCFLGKYAAGEAYANCDGSTTAPVLNVADFGCFLGKYAAGCP